MAKNGGETGDALIGDDRRPSGSRRIEQAHPLDGGLPDELGAFEPLFQGGVIDVDQPLLHQCQQPADFSLRFRDRAPRLGQMFAVAGLGFRRTGDIGFQNNFEALGGDQAVGQMPEHYSVEHGHGDAASRTERPALLRSAGAGIIAIPAALAGTHGHAGSTIRAACDAGQQGRAADDARGHSPGAAGLQAGPNLLELFRRDDLRHGERNPLIDRLAAAGACLPPVELVVAGVGDGRQDPMDARDMERLATIAATLLVQPIDDRLDAERDAGAAEREVEDAAHDCGLRIVDGEDLLDLLAAPFRADRVIAEGRPRAIPETLPGVLLHGAQRVLGILATLIFIETAEDLPDQVAGGVVRELLGHRLQIDAGLAQFTDIHLAEELLAEEPRHRMDQDQVKGVGRRGGGVDHVLELGAPVIGRRGARLDEGLGQHHAPRGAEIPPLLDLIGDRQFALRLARRRNADIQGYASSWPLGAGHWGA